MSISSYRVGASIVGAHIVFFCLLFFLNCSQKNFPHVLFQPAMEDMETLNLHTHILDCLLTRVEAESPPPLTKYEGKNQSDYTQFRASSFNFVTLLASFQVR